MKKLIAFCVLVFVASSIFGQNMDTKGILLTSKKVTQDTAIVLTVPTNQAWGIVIRWTSSTSTASTAIIKCSKDNGVSYQTYAGFTAQTITGATGNMAFEDFWCTSDHLQVYIDISGSEVATLTIEYILRRAY